LQSLYISPKKYGISGSPQNKDTDMKYLKMKQ